MAKIQSKNSFPLNQIKLKKRQNISGFKTIIKLRANRELYKRYLNKAIALAQTKLDNEETKLDIKAKIIAESIVKIFDLKMFNFFKKFAAQISKQID